MLRIFPQLSCQSRHVCFTKMPSTLKLGCSVVFLLFYDFFGLWVAYIRYVVSSPTRMYLQEAT